MRVSLFQAVGQLLLTLACAGLSSTPSLDICAAHHSIGEAWHQVGRGIHQRRASLSCSLLLKQVHPVPQSPLRAYPDPSGPPSERRGRRRVQLEAAGWSSRGQDNGGDGWPRSDGQWTGRMDVSKCV